MDATLIKGLRVLETLARSRRPSGVTELARELGLPKSNVHRTLQTLVSAGYVRGTGAGAYDCTLKLFELGSTVVGKIDIRTQAESIMLELAEATRETVHLSVLDGLDVVYLHKIDSPEPVRAYSQIGGRAPAHCVASGKALLAYQPRERLDDLPDPLPTHTEATIAGADEMRAALDVVRREGYAVNHGEWRAQVGGVAAAVFDASGAPAASVGISGPLSRVEPDLTAHIPRVIAAARRISTAAGCRDYDALATGGTA